MEKGIEIAMNKRMIDILSKVSGISEKGIRKIAKEVVANNKKLKSCKHHSFDIEKNKAWICSHCKGQVSASSKLWYERGLEHAKHWYEKGQKHDKVDKK